MSATEADLTTPNVTSIPPVHQSQGSARGRQARRNAAKMANAKMPADGVTHDESAAKRLAQEAALGQGLMQLDAALAQTMQASTMQAEVAAGQISGADPVARQRDDVLTQAVQLTLMAYIESERMQAAKFKNERVKKDARYVTDERKGLTPGKEVESAGAAGATA